MSRWIAAVLCLGLLVPFAGAEERGSKKGSPRRGSKGEKERRGAAGERSEKGDPPRGERCEGGECDKGEARSDASKDERAAPMERLQREFMAHHREAIERIEALRGEARERAVERLRKEWRAFLERVRTHRPELLDERGRGEKAGERAERGERGERGERDRKGGGAGGARPEPKRPLK